MTECKEEKSVLCTFDNFELKWWLRRAGNENRRNKLIKLKDDLKRLQLSRRAVHRGLMQLARKPYVVLNRLILAQSCHKKTQLSPQDKDLLQSPHDSSSRNSVPFHKERWQSKHQKDDEKKLPLRSSDNSQKSDIQIVDGSVKLNASSSVETASSGIIADNIYQTKIQERSSAKNSPDSAVRDSIQKAEERKSHINCNITLKNNQDISSKRSSTNVKLDSPAKSESPSKFAYDSIREFRNKSSQSKSDIVSKDRFFNKKHSQRNKLLEANVPSQLKKHHSKSNTNTSKNDAIFQKERSSDEKEQKGYREVNQDSYSLKIELFNYMRLQERGRESKNKTISCKSNVNVSSDTIISNSRTYLEAETNNVADETEDASILNIQTSRADSESLAEQAHASATKIFAKININQDKNIKTKLIDQQRNSLSVETDSKTADKKRIYSGSSDKSEEKLRKKYKKKKVSSDRSLDENSIENNTEIFDCQVVSENKRIYDNNENENQMYSKKITIYEYITKKRETHWYLKQRRKLQKKRQSKKIRKIRKKFSALFRDCCILSKSESEEESEIISKCLKKKKRQFISSNSEIYDTFNDITTEEEAEDIHDRDGILKYKYRHDMSVNNSQDETESMISTKAESVNSTDSTIYNKNDTLHGFITDEEMEKTNSNGNQNLTRKRNLVDILQEDREIAIAAKIPCIEYSISIADAENIINESDVDSENAIYVQTKETTIQNTQEDQENIENVNFKDAEMEEANVQENQENIENINLKDVACEKEEEVIIQEDNNIEIVNLKDSAYGKTKVTIQEDKYNNIENASLEDAAYEKKEVTIQDKKNIENTNLEDTTHEKTEKVTVQEDKKNIKNSNLEDATYPETKEVTVQEDKKNIKNANLKDAAYAETKDISAQNTEENQENIENVNLTDNIQIQRDIRPNLFNCQLLSTMSAQELISNIEKKDDCDKPQNVDNISLMNNEYVAENITTVITDAQALITSPKSKESSSNKNVLNETSSSTSNVHSRSEPTSDHLEVDEDNISDIEVEIKIKPKSKNRISQKFSMKAPLSTYIKTLNTFKNSPDIFEFFQMNLERFSENSRHENTVMSESNETKNTSEKSSNVSQDDTVETASNTREVTCDSSHIIKDNANHSSKQQQVQSSQNDTISDRDKNTTQHHQEEKNKSIQSIEGENTQMTDENASESAKSAHDTSDLEKQSSKTSSNDERNTSDAQQTNLQNDIIILYENKDTTKRNQEKVSANQKRMQAESSVEPAKSTCDTRSDSGEQLPKISSTTSNAKHIGGVRVRTSAELGSSWNSVPINLSQNSDASIGSINACSMTSASSVCTQLPLYNTAMYYSSRMNRPSVSTENVPLNFVDELTKTSAQNLVINVCVNFQLCRMIIHNGICTREKIYELRNNLINVYQDIKILKVILSAKNDEYVINYVNQRKLINPPITISEFRYYKEITIFESNVSVACLDVDMRYCNMPQATNINNIPGAPVPNVHAQRSPFVGNVPRNVPAHRTQYPRAQCSTMPHPGSNTNQSQSSRSNSSQLKQLLSNSCPKVPSTGVSVSNPIPNPSIYQQSIGNARYAQTQRMPDISNVNNQQFFINPGNGTSSSTASASNVNNQQFFINSGNGTSSSTASTSNINNQQFFTNPGNGTSSSTASASNINTRIHHAYPSPTHLGNTNVSSTTDKDSHTRKRTITTSNTFPVQSTTNVYQQNQTPYTQIYINSGASHFPSHVPPYTTNQTINGPHQTIYNVTQLNFSVTNANASRSGVNVTGNVVPGNPSVNPQNPSISAERNISQYNTISQNVSNIYTSQSTNVQDISPNPNLQQQNLQQNLQLFKDASVRSTYSYNNVILQNAQTFNKKTGILEVQARDSVPNRIPNPQQVVGSCQGSSCAYNVSQNPPGCSPKTAISQEPSVSQNVTSNATLQRNKTILFSPKSTPSPPNEIVRHQFDLSILTDIQKIILKDQLEAYLKQISFTQQDSEKIRLEKKILVFFYDSLRHEIIKMLKKNENVSKSHTEKELRNDILRRESIILNQQSEIESLRNTTQSSQNNENCSICDKVQKRPPLEKNIDSNASISSTSTTIKSKDLSVEAQNRKTPLNSTPRSTTTEEPPEIVNLQKHIKDTPKIRCKKNFSLAMTKKSENIETPLAEHSNIPKENPIEETSHKIAETEAQDNAKVNETSRSPAKDSHDQQVSESCSSPVQDTSNSLRVALTDETEICLKTAEDSAKEADNVEMGSEISNDAILNNIRENDAVSQCLFNTEIQDKEILEEEEALHDKQMSESCSSLTQNMSNLLQDEETKDDNIERSDNVKTTNASKISNVAILNSSRGNEKSASQVPCNTEAEEEIKNRKDKELYHDEAYLNNEIFNEDSQEDTGKNIEEFKSNFVEADAICIPRTSTPVSLDELLFPTNESAKTTQAYIACKSYTFETFSTFFSYTQQEDPACEQTDNSGKTCESESSGCLYIDESAAKSEWQEEQSDKVSSEKDQPDKSQDLRSDETTCESVEKDTSSSLFAEGYRLLAMVEQNVEKLDEQSPLDQEEMQTENLLEISNESIDTLEQSDVENQIQITDTHSGVKAINELLKCVSEHKYYGKLKTSSCNPTMKGNNININANVVGENDISDANVDDLAKSKDNKPDSDIIMNILNVRSISPSLFEKIDNIDMLSGDDFPSLNEKEEKSSDVNDNLEVSNFVSLNETKEEESSDGNDNPEVPNSASLNEMTEEKSLDVNDNSEVSNLMSANEIKIDMFSIMDDDLDIFESISLNDMKEEKSDINDNSEVPNIASLNILKEEELSDVNYNPEIIDSMSYEIKKEMLSIIEDNPEVFNSVSLNDTKEETSVMSDNPEESTSSPSLSEMKEGKSSNVNDNPDEMDVNVNLDEMEEDKPCLRCKRKSTVFCEACMEAPYCSKRCADLHWKASHYKHCKDTFRNSSISFIYID